MSVSAMPAPAPAPAPAAPAAAPQTAAPAAAPAVTPTTPSEAATTEPTNPAFDWNTWSFDYEGDVPDEYRPVAERLKTLHQERLTSAQQEAAAEHERLQTIAKFWQNAAGGGDEDVDILGIQQEAQELRDAKARGEITEKQLREELTKLNMELAELRDLRERYDTDVRDQVYAFVDQQTDRLWEGMSGAVGKFLDEGLDAPERVAFVDKLIEGITAQSGEFPLELIEPILSADTPTREEFMELFGEGMRADKAFARAQRGAAAREKAAQEKVDTVLTGPTGRGSVPLRGGQNPQEARPQQRGSLLNQKFA
jgi:hypothetical protein